MSLRAEDVAVGAQLSELRIPLTATRVVSTAIASRDFQNVHHDRDAAQGQGAKDIFLNILTTNGYVVRLVTDWAGPDAIVKATSIRLGVPAFAGDELVLSGEVTELAEGVATVTVRGTDSLGDHVVGTVTVVLPAGGGAS